MVVDDAGRKVTLTGTAAANRQHRAGRDGNAARGGAGDKVIATVEFSDEPAAAKAIPA